MLTGAFAAVVLGLLGVGAMIVSINRRRPTRK